MPRRHLVGDWDASVHRNARPLCLFQRDARFVYSDMIRSLFKALRCADAFSVDPEFPHPTGFLDDLHIFLLLEALVPMLTATGRTHSGGWLRAAVVPRLNKRDSMADRVRKDTTTPRESRRVLLDLTPRKDPKGGLFGFSKSSPLPIPPPGFISSPQNGSAHRDC